MSNKLPEIQIKESTSNNTTAYIPDSEVLTMLNSNPDFKNIQENVKRKNTVDTYKIYMDKYTNYCTKNSFNINSQVSLLSFLQSIRDSGLKLQTLKTAYYSVMPHFEKNSLPLNSYVFKNYFTGVANIIVKTESVKEKTKAITLEMLSSKEDEFSNKYKDLLFMLYFGAFRVSELLNVRKKDVVINGIGIYITIRDAKNLKNGAELVKSIRYTSKENCPVRSFAELVNNTEENEKVYEGFDRFSITRYISRKFKGYSAHSLRAGFVTDMVNSKQSLEEICKHTGQTAATAQKYIDNIDIDKNNASHTATQNYSDLNR